MSNLIIDFAVDIDRETAVTAASTAYLRKLGVFCTRGANFPTVDDGEGGEIADTSIEVVKCTKYNSPDSNGDYDTNDAKLYTDDLGISSLIDSLGYIYLIFTTDASVVKTQSASKFYTITHTAEAVNSESDANTVCAALATFEGVVIAADQLDSLGDGLTTSGKICLFATSVYDSSQDPTYSADMHFSAICDLLGDSSWRNQQYSELAIKESLTSTARIQNASVTTIGDAESYFDSYTSFYLYNEEDETAYLGFFATTDGLSITTPYVRAEIEIGIQNRFVSYVSLNESYNVETARRSIQQYCNKLIKSYVSDGMLDGDGENSVTISTSDNRFYVNGTMYVTNAMALWRASFTAYYAESPSSADGSTIS